MRTAIFSLVLLSCGGGMSDLDFASLQNAQRLNQREYELLESGDAGLPARAMARGAYCSTLAVLSRNGNASMDAGTIECAP